MRARMEFVLGLFIGGAVGVIVMSWLQIHK